MSDQSNREKLMELAKQAGFYFQTITEHAPTQHTVAYKYSEECLHRFADLLLAEQAQPTIEPAFPERDLTKPAEQQGMFRKFDVRRVDGSDQPGGKHHGCRYFVLDLDHDAYAPAAMRAYAEACRSTHPQLAADIEAEFNAEPTIEPVADKDDPTFTQTNRGFRLVEFTDRYGVKCSLQESSLATEGAVWFGCDDANPRVLIPGEGWKPVDIPAECSINTRMHLTQDKVRELLPLLYHFAETGELPSSPVSGAVDEREALAKEARDLSASLRFDRDCPKCAAVFPDRETKSAADLLEQLAALSIAQPAAQTKEPVHAALEDNEQYRMQMAGISTAAIGYWKEGDEIHPDYDTVALRDVAKLYAAYDELHKKVHPTVAPQAQTTQEVTDAEFTEALDDIVSSLLSSKPSNDAAIDESVFPPLPPAIYRHPTLGELYDRLAVHQYAVRAADPIHAALTAAAPQPVAAHTGDDRNWQLREGDPFAVEVKGGEDV